MGSQLLKFALVGVVNNVVVYGVYLIATYLGGTPKLTMSILYVLSVFISFLVNKNWTFEYDSKNGSALTKYIASNAVGYGINFMILYFFVDLNHWSHQYVQGVSIVIVAVILFLMNKYFVFKAQ